MVHGNQGREWMGKERKYCKHNLSCAEFGASNYSLNKECLICMSFFLSVHTLYPDRQWKGESFSQQWRTKLRSKQNLHFIQPSSGKPRWFPSFLWLFPRGKRHLISKSHYKFAPIWHKVNVTGREIINLKYQLASLGWQSHVQALFGDLKAWGEKKTKEWSSSAKDVIL